MKEVWRHATACRQKAGQLAAFPTNKKSFERFVGFVTKKKQ